MTCNVLVGGGWGDEGKGKCITYLCFNDKPDIIARAGVGPNAGHSVEFNGEKYGLRMIPSGFVHTGARLLIGAGVLVIQKYSTMNSTTSINTMLKKGLLQITGLQ